MAITIIQQPETYSPVYNPLTIVADSTNKGQTGFRYLFDVYRAGDSSYYTRHRISPRDADGGFGVFDPRRILESLVTHDIQMGITGITKNANSYIGYVVEIGEEYGSTVDEGLESVSGFAYNAVFDEDEFLSYAPLEYVCNVGPTSAQFLTNMPSSVNIRSTEHAWLHWMMQADGTESVGIKTYDSTGAMIGHYKVDNSFAAIPDDDSRFLRFPAGPASIALIPAIDVDQVVASPMPVISASVASYTIYIRRTGGTPATPEQEFVITEPCTKFPIHRFHFLNTLGGIDSFSFTKVHRKRSDIQRSTYKQQRGRFVTSSSYTHTKADHGLKDHYIRMQDKELFNSDWISEEESDWLYELASSPIVFKEENEELIAYKIMASEFQHKTNTVDKLIQLQLEMVPARYNYRQRY